MKLKHYIVLSAIAIVSLFASASSPISDAAKAYTDGDFAKAITIYKDIEKESGTSASLLCNLGNAYFKVGDYGNAMLCYRRALQLDPGNSVAKNNADYLSNKVADINKGNLGSKNLSVSPDEPSFFAKLSQSLVYSVSSNTWGVWGCILFILLLASVAVYLFCGNVLLKKIGFFGGLVMIPLIVMCICFSMMVANNNDLHRSGVITAFSATLKGEPSSLAGGSTTALSKGTQLEILETEQESGHTWYKVRLNSDFVGWISQADFTVI